MTLNEDKMDALQLQEIVDIIMFNIFNRFEVDGEEIIQSTDTLLVQRYDGYLKIQEVLSELESELEDRTSIIRQELRYRLDSHPIEGVDFDCTSRRWIVDQELLVEKLISYGFLNSNVADKRTLTMTDVDKFVPKDKQIELLSDCIEISVNKGKIIRTNQFDNMIKSLDNNKKFD